MAYPNAKVYFDGSHYIAIPHTERPSRRRYRVREETITVVPESADAEEKDERNKRADASSEEMTSDSQKEASPLPFDESDEPIDDLAETTQRDENKGLPAVGEQMTRKEYFNRLYEEHLFKKRSEKRAIILRAMRPYFETDSEAELYVDSNLERRWRNLMARRIRMTRKINLGQFNYFCTFTYDDKLHTEDSFRKRLKHTFEVFSWRMDWKYIGVWERSPEKQRLHFHGLFEIQNEALPGMMVVKEDYNFKTHTRQKIHQSIYFLERFGRNDFELIDEPGSLGSAIAYLVKYIEKTGEKIVCSKGLSQYFISDILESDVVTTYGVEDKKLLLFDDFSCFDEGCYVGQVSPEVIRQLRKSN